MYACKGFTCYQNYELAQLDYSAPKRAPKNPVKFHAKGFCLCVNLGEKVPLGPVHINGFLVDSDLLKYAENGIKGLKR